MIQTTPTPNSIWLCHNHNQFKVVRVTEDADPWIYYTNKDKKEFSCRLEAFINRFRPEPK